MIFSGIPAHFVHPGQRRWVPWESLVIWRSLVRFPMVCMSKCPWARYWTPNCSWCAGRHLALQPLSSVYVWITACRFGQKRLLFTGYLCDKWRKHLKKRMRQRELPHKHKGVMQVWWRMSEATVFYDVWHSNGHQHLHHIKFGQIVFTTVFL